VGGAYGGPDVGVCAEVDVSRGLRLFQESVKRMITFKKKVVQLKGRHTSSSNRNSKQGGEEKPYVGERGEQTNVEKNSLLELSYS